MDLPLDVTCKTLVDNLPDGVCCTDKVGVIHRANRSLALMLGVAIQEQLTGQSLLSFVQ